MLWQFSLFHNCWSVECCSDEIARCLEKAYEKIGFSEARRMLFFDTDQLMLNYAREVRNSYSRKKCLQQLDPHEHCDCDAEKMMQAYAEKVSPTCVPCEGCLAWPVQSSVLYRPDTS